MLLDFIREVRLAIDRFRGALLTTALLLGPATAAMAHAILVRSQPAVNGVVGAGPLGIEFSFNSRIDRARSRLTLTGPDHAEVVLPILPDGPENVILSRADVTSGVYSVHWQVLATDGHITRGVVPFTVEEH